MSDSEFLQCECEGLDHEKFNSILSDELRKNITVHDVFNRDYCVMLSVDKIDEDEGLSVHEYLTDLKGKMGVYGLWIEHTECYDHDMHRMLCLYAGKGFALGRIKSHITEKWPE